MDWLQLGVPVWQLVVRCIVIDLVMVIALRVFGKRQVGQFTLYDLVLILLIANAVQPAMTGPDNSLTGGVIIIIDLVVFNWMLAQLDRSAFFHRVLFAAPRELIKDGRYLTDAMRHEGLEQEEMEEAMREHGIDDVSKVKLAMLESDGNISIVPKESGGSRATRRRVRFTRHR